MHPPAPDNPPGPAKEPEPGDPAPPPLKLPSDDSPPARDKEPARESKPACGKEPERENPAPAKPPRKRPFDDDRPAVSTTLEPGDLLQVRSSVARFAKVYRNEERRKDGRSFAVMNGETVKILETGAEWCKVEVRSGVYRDVVCLIATKELTTFPPPRKATATSLGLGLARE